MKNVILIIVVTVFSVSCSNFPENPNLKEPSPQTDIKLNIGKPIYKIISGKSAPQVSTLPDNRKKYVLTETYEASDELPPTCMKDFDGYESCIPGFGINGFIDKDTYIVDSKGIVIDAKRSYEEIPFKPYVKPSILEEVLPPCVRENMLRIPCEIR